MSTQAISATGLDLNVPVPCRPWGWIFSPPVGLPPTYRNVNEYRVRNKNSLIRTSTPALSFGFGGLVIGISGWLYSKLKETGSTQYLFGALGVLGAAFLLVSRKFGGGSIRDLISRYGTSSIAGLESRDSKGYVPISKEAFIALLRSAYTDADHTSGRDKLAKPESSMLSVVKLAEQLKEHNADTFVPWLFELALESSDASDRLISQQCLNALTGSLRREIIARGLISYLAVKYGRGRVISSLAELLELGDDIKTLHGFVADAFGLLKSKESISYLTNYMRNNPEDSEMVQSCIFAIAGISGVRALKELLDADLPEIVKQKMGFCIARLDSKPYTAVTETDLTVDQLVDTLKNRRMSTAQRVQIANLLLNYERETPGFAEELFNVVGDTGTDSLSRIVALRILVYRNDKSIVDYAAMNLKTNPRRNIFSRTVSGFVLCKKDDSHAIRALTSCLNDGDIYAKHIAEIALMGIAERRSVIPFKSSSEFFSNAQPVDTKLPTDLKLSKFSVLSEIGKLSEECSYLELGPIIGGGPPQFYVKEERIY